MGALAIARAYNKNEMATQKTAEKALGRDAVASARNSETAH
jgi:hypothetical protein